MITLAEKKHIEAIHGLLQACAVHLSQQGIEQWPVEYPDMAAVREDVRLGQAFVVLDEGRVVAAVTINETQDPQYANINWKYKEGPVLVVHRLGVHPDFQGKAYGHQLMSFAEDFAKEKGYKAIRLDAYVGNPRSQAFYRRGGYVECGFVKFDYQRFNCTCFEKQVK